MEPDSWLLCRYKPLGLGLDPGFVAPVRVIPAGMEPDSWLLSKRTWYSQDKEPMSLGMRPTSWFSPRSNHSRADREVIPGGMIPRIRAPGLPRRFSRFTRPLSSRTPSQVSIRPEPQERNG